MTLFLELTREDFAAANKVVRLAEFEFMLLERSSLSVTPSFADSGRKLPPAELKFIHRALVSHCSPKNLRIRVMFRMRGQEANSDARALLAMSATFVAEYSFQTEVELSAEECRAFADANGIMTCWPYWRELVQSNIARMALPPLTLPFMKIRPKTEETPEVQRPKSKEAEPARK